MPNATDKAAAATAFVRLDSGAIVSGCRRSSRVTTAPTASTATMTLSSQGGRRLSTRPVGPVGHGSEPAMCGHRGCGSGNLCGGLSFIEVSPSQ